MDEIDESTKSITTLKQLGEYVLKISDMGLSKQLDHGEVSFSFTSMSMSRTLSHQQVQPNDSFNSSQSSGSSSGEGRAAAADVVGTMGWQAPEVNSTVLISFPLFSLCFSLFLSSFSCYLFLKFLLYPLIRLAFRMLVVATVA